MNLKVDLTSPNRPSLPRDNGKHHLDEANNASLIDVKKPRINGSADVLNDVKPLALDVKDTIKDKATIAATAASTTAADPCKEGSFPSILKENSSVEDKVMALPLIMPKSVTSLALSKRVTDDVDSYVKKMAKLDQKIDNDSSFIGQEHDKKV